jgi:hypothetical protein
MHICGLFGMQEEKKRGYRDNYFPPAPLMLMTSNSDSSDGCTILTSAWSSNILIMSEMLGQLYEIPKQFGKTKALTL